MAISMTKEDNIMLGENILRLRQDANLSQEELAIKLNVVRQTISKWEQALSVPDASMLIHLAEEFNTSVSALLGEDIAENKSDDLKVLSEKLEVINLELAKRNETKIKVIRYFFIEICVLIVLGFTLIALTSNEFMTWDYNDPELAIAGTILHGISWVFVRVAPIIFVIAIIGIILTYRKG